MTEFATNKKRLYLDMDNVIVDFKSGIDKLDEKTQKEYENRLDEVPGIFALMEPMRGAIESIRLLAEHYDVYILSTAPWKNPSAWADKVAWVTKYLDDILHKRIIISHHKDFCKGDYLVDDRPKNGTAEFEGEWIAFGSEKFPDWKAVCDYLLPNMYEKALQIAHEAHAGQKDKAGNDYISHPIRVAQRCKSNDAKIVALLHDTIEDTSITPTALRNYGFSDKIIEAILSVTRKEDETYAEFIERAAQNHIGKEVKIADLEDNMDLRRLPDINSEDLERCNKYLHSWRYLNGLEPDTSLINK